MDRSLGAYEGYVQVPGTTLEMSRVGGFIISMGVKTRFPALIHQNSYLINIPSR